MPHLDVNRRRELARKKYAEKRADPEWWEAQKKKNEERNRKYKENPEGRAKSYEASRRYREKIKAGLVPSRIKEPAPPPRQPKKRMDKEEQKAHWREYLKTWRQSETGRMSGLRRMLKKDYGLTLEQYEEMFHAQRGCCFLCGDKKELHGMKTNRLYVDHCHNSGRVRKLLCNSCNSALALFRENQNVMREAIDYLQMFSEGS